MDEEGRLRNLTQKAQALSRARRPRLLADVLEQYIAQNIEPQKKSSGTVIEAWQELVPKDLISFCRVVLVSRGSVRIAVNSPAALYQLRLAGPDLLRKMQQKCGRTAVKELKFELGR